MNNIVRDQILAIRESGVANMFDLTGVQCAAYDQGFFELILYLEDHRSDYTRFILTGNADDQD